MGESGGVVAPGRSTPPAESFIAANLSSAAVLTPSVPLSAAAAGAVAALGRGLSPNVSAPLPLAPGPVSCVSNVRGSDVDFFLHQRHKASARELRPVRQDPRRNCSSACWKVVGRWYATYTRPGSTWDRRQQGSKQAGARHA